MNVAFRPCGISFRRLAFLAEFFRSLFILQLQIAFAEGAGGFNPLKMSRDEGAFRPGSAPPRLNTTVVLSPC
jgi:hypothetical protein